MRARRDALAAAAQWIAAVEATARAGAGLVATVGEIVARPGVANVIPGEVRCSLDVRHADDDERAAAVDSMRSIAQTAAQERHLELEWRELQSTPAVRCDPALTETLARAAQGVLGTVVPRLPSGAGHDAMMLASIAPVAMLFVRCREGVSHHPAESVSEPDVRTALSAIVAALEAMSA
jgi:allantoate deiminase